MKKSSFLAKTHSLRTYRNKRIKNLALVGCIVLVTLWIVPQAFSWLATTAMTPIYTVESWFKYSTDSFPQFIRDRNELVAELNRLKEHSPEVVGDKLVIGRLQKENQALRSLVQNESTQRVLAGVINRPNLTPYDVLVLDRGSKDGIVVGAPVYVSSDVVVGVVSDVDDHQSLVELVTSPGFKSTVFIYGSEIYTTAVGQGGGVVRVGVPQGVPLAIGDIVVLPTVDPGLFGEIVHVESLPTQAEQYGYITTEVPLSSIRFVTVGTESVQPATFESVEAMVNETRSTLFQAPVPEDLLVDLASVGMTSPTSTATAATSTETERN